MGKLPIHWIEARTYAHATEDEERVARALAFAFPEGPTAREALEGHFGNPLVRLTRRVEDGKHIRSVWELWAAAGLPSSLREDVDARVDEDGILHFRLDKQAAFGDSLSLAKDPDSIDVRLKLMAYPAKPEVARAVARAVLAEGI